MRIIRSLDERLTILTHTVLALSAEDVGDALDGLKRLISIISILAEAHGVHVPDDSPESIRAVTSIPIRKLALDAIRATANTHGISVQASDEVDGRIETVDLPMTGVPLNKLALLVMAATADLYLSCTGSDDIDYTYAPESVGVLRLIVAEIESRYASPTKEVTA